MKHVLDLVLPATADKLNSGLFSLAAGFFRFSNGGVSQAASDKTLEWLLRQHCKDVSALRWLARSGAPTP